MGENCTAPISLATFPLDRPHLLLAAARHPSSCPFTRLLIKAPELLPIHAAADPSIAPAAKVCWAGVLGRYYITSRRLLGNALGLREKRSAATLAQPRVPSSFHGTAAPQSGCRSRGFDVASPWLRRHCSVTPCSVPSRLLLCKAGAGRHLGQDKTRLLFAGCGLAHIKQASTRIPARRCAPSRRGRLLPRRT